MIHVVTPFSRPLNAPILLRHLARQGAAVTWHVLVSSVEFPYECRRDWIRPMWVVVPDGVDPFCYKLHAFVESGEIVDGDRYVVLCDDDLFEEGALGAVADMSERIVVISMLRGHQVPAHADNGYLHPITTLTAAAENMRVGEMGLQQCFIAGEIFRQLGQAMERAPFCDGLAGEWLAAHYADEIRYEPGLFVLFNRLEPGRWAVDNDEVERWR